jgi:hypothetical protein
MSFRLTKCSLFLKALRKAFQKQKLQFFGELEALRDEAAFRGYLASLENTEWVVYAKHPFGGPRNRILDVSNGEVRFRPKDYPGKGKQEIARHDA